MSVERIEALRQTMQHCGNGESAVAPLHDSENCGEPQ
jgi:hypothetical protein